MRTLSLTSLIAAAIFGSFSVNANALCKEYPTRAENRNGAIGGKLDDRGLDAIGASGEQPCRKDGPETPKHPPKKGPRSADTSNATKSTTPPPKP
jgi:hypothetical protein